MSGKYDDIIHLPHHLSPTRPQMSIANRAAQFSPFAALSGYDAAIQETARTTDRRIELDENGVAALDIKLHILAENLTVRPEVTITYFQEDERKEGGSYVTVSGAVKKIDNAAGAVVLTNGKRIDIREILNIDCALFNPMIE